MNYRNKAQHPVGIGGRGTNLRGFMLGAASYRCRFRGAVGYSMSARGEKAVMEAVLGTEHIRLRMKKQPREFFAT